MAREEKSRVEDVIRKYEKEILDEWLKLQTGSRAYRADLISEKDLRQDSQAFLSSFIDAVQSGTSGEGGQWDEVRNLLGQLSRSRALKGFSPSETATFVFSLKQPLFEKLRDELSGNTQAFAEETWKITTILDNLGLKTTELYLKTREEVIRRQQQDMLELSTPVVSLWEGIVALPIIGTLDSNRTQMVMETLLQRIVELEAAIAIIDITGVPTVDTLVAQHLLKAVAAARLMGADCIISGIRPQIAQTIVHLGVTLGEVITKATLADAFALALTKTGRKVVRMGAATS
ncbi:MAG TPA: STAS domain-containing protein [Thermoanaerobaculia bacterium]|nr:STAS domain-containing protein [Thermoanaerobaculia bacterium]